MFIDNKSAFLHLSVLPEASRSSLGWNSTALTAALCILRSVSSLPAVRSHSWKREAALKQTITLNAFSFLLITLFPLFFTITPLVISTSLLAFYPFSLQSVLSLSFMLLCPFSSHHHSHSIPVPPSTLSITLPSHLTVPSFSLWTSPLTAVFPFPSHLPFIMLLCYKWWIQQFLCTTTTVQKWREYSAMTWLVYPLL